jgi:glycosyltransferase involved in cell wall biosynthesis
VKICHIITRLVIGGAQENTLLTCAGLHERGHEVALITGPDAGPEGTLLEEARAGGYAVYVVPEMRRAIQPWRDLSSVRSIRRLLRQLAPEVVHTHSSKAGIVGRLAAQKERARVIVHTVHGMSFNRTQPRTLQMVYRMAERYCGGFTDRFVSVADAMTAQCVGAGIAPAEKFVTIYSGMRTEWFTPSAYDRAAIREQWGVGPNQVVVGTIARLFRNKGYEQLIPAMADAARRDRALRFVWIGDGAQRAEYERRLEALGIRDRVHLTGLLPPRQVPEALAGIDMLVHASLWEGLPRAAVQALLMERPVISFDIDGAPEVVRPGQTGSLVPLNDLPRLAEAMLELAADPALREQFGRGGRALCVQRFDHRVMVDSIEGLYGELLGGSNAPRDGSSHLPAPSASEG